MQRTTTNTAQLAFDGLLAYAEEANERRIFEKATAHLPGNWTDALPFYRGLLELHHAAMLDANELEVIRLRGDAHWLAEKLNGGTGMGICAPEGPGKRLESEAAAAPGDIPKWGQAGSFVIDHDGIAIRIEVDGLFGIGSRHGFWPGFSAHVVNRKRPFISETGYRSFLGCGFSRLVPHQTPEEFVRLILTDHVNNYLGGKLLKIKSGKQQVTAAQ